MPALAAARTCWSASMKPISSAFTSTLCGAPSLASTLVSAIPAARVTEVGALARRGADGLERLVERLAPARDNRDVGARRRKPGRDRKPDALAAAGHHGRAAGQTDFHFNSPCDRRMLNRHGRDEPGHDGWLNG